MNFAVQIRKRLHFDMFSDGRRDLRPCPAANAVPQHEHWKEGFWMDGFLFDPHTHTAEASKCGRLPAAEVVDRYMRHGFAGLVVTDHLHPEYLSRIDTEHDWNAVCDYYLSGYHASKRRGGEAGFQVILGAELRFPENHNDQALDLCCRHPAYFRLTGSDTHRDGDEARAGVILPEKPADSFAYKALIESRRFRLWSPEFQSFVDADEEMRKEEPK